MIPKIEDEAIASGAVVKGFNLTPFGETRNERFARMIYVNKYEIIKNISRISRTKQ